MSSGEVDLRVWRGRGGGAFSFFAFSFAFLPGVKLLSFTFLHPMPFKSSLRRWVVENTMFFFVSRAASPPFLVTEAQWPPEKHLYFVLMLFDTRDKQCWHRARAIVKLSGMVMWPIPGNVNYVSELLPIHLWKTFSPKWKCWADGHEAWSSWNILTWQQGSAQ